MYLCKAIAHPIMKIVSFHSSYLLEWGSTEISKNAKLLIKSDKVITDFPHLSSNQANRIFSGRLS